MHLETLYVDDEYHIHSHSDHHFSKISVNDFVLVPFSQPWP